MLKWLQEKLNQTLVCRAELALFGLKKIFLIFRVVGADVHVMGRISGFFCFTRNVFGLRVMIILTPSW